MNTMFLKVLNLFTMVMSVVEQVKGAGNGQEKADLAIKLLPELLSAAETTIGKDVFNQPKVQEAARAFFTAAINLVKGIDAAKHAKGTGGTPQ